MSEKIQFSLQGKCYWVTVLRHSPNCTISFSEREKNCVLCVWTVLLSSFLVSQLNEGWPGGGWQLVPSCRSTLGRSRAARGTREAPALAIGHLPGMGRGHRPAGCRGMVMLGGALAALKQNCESCDDRRKKKIGHDDVDYSE